MPIPALMAAGAAVLGNVIGSRNQKKTNDANMKIAQMNNEWSEKMMQKQMDYNTLMWEKQNEYNDPSAWVERIKKAKLNPAHVLSNLPTGFAGSSSPSLPSPSTPTMQPYRYDLSGFGEAVTTAMRVQNETKLADAQARLTNLNADYYGAKAMAEIGKIGAETKFTDAKRYYQVLQNSIGKDMLGAQYIGQIRRNQSEEIAIHNAIRQGVLMDKQIAKYDEETNARIGDLVASAALKYAQGQLNKAQLKKVIQEEKGLKLSNREKDAIFDYVVEKAKYDASRAADPQNIWQGMSDAYRGFNKYVDNEIISRSKRLWKDTRRSFGLYW